MRFPLILVTALISSPCLADSLEFTPAYRSGLRHHWRGTELALRYAGQEFSGFTYGAALSNTLWRVDRKRRGQTLEFAPEARYNFALDQSVLFAGVAYALASDGDFTVEGQRLGAKILGPRLNLGCLYPLDAVVLSFGVGKGWETLKIYGDSHESEPLASHSFFLGVSL